MLGVVNWLIIKIPFKMFKYKRMTAGFEHCSSGTEAFRCSGYIYIYYIYIYIFVFWEILGRVVYCLNLFLQVEIYTSQFCEGFGRGDDYIKVFGFKAMCDMGKCRYKSLLENIIEIHGHILTYDMGIR